MPYFSIIVPAFNRALLLRSALESILSQGCTDYEVIVVDDGSTDDTTSVVRSYSSRIKFLQHQNRGPGAARNFGAEQAKGEYLAFLDSDDLWFPGRSGFIAKSFKLKIARPSLQVNLIVFGMRANWR